MFYLFTFLSIALVLTGFILAKRFVKNKEKFDNIISKTLKISVVVFCVISFLTILLPDAFALCFDNEALTLSYKEVSFAIVRWFSTLSFINVAYCCVLQKQNNKKHCNILLFNYDNCVNLLLPCLFGSFHFNNGSRH